MKMEVCMFCHICQKSLLFVNTVLCRPYADVTTIEILAALAFDIGA